MRITKRPLLLGVTGLAILSLLVGAYSFAHVTSTRAASGSNGGFTRTISSSGTTSFAAGAMLASGGGVAVQDPEFANGGADASADASGGGGDQGVDRSFSGPTTGNGRAVNPHKQAKSNPELGVHFQGLNFNDQRFANGGNQFSVEPPDQGMCAGNGFIVETLNDVIQVYNTSGTPLLNGGHAVDLNTFYGYPAAINRTTGKQGQFVTDPSCLFDQATGHFINLVLTLEVKPTNPSRGRFLGPNHLDIAVSNTSDPTGTWTIYRLPVQDDGTQGTPDHHCFPSPNPPPVFRTNPRACLGDYPHIGADANGIYLETNEYDLFGNGFHGSQIYAISKTQLTSLPSSITVTQFDTATLAPGGKPGFTIWPTQSSPDQFDANNGGTEFFLSSTAADEAQCPSEAQGCSGSGMSDKILLWSLTNTSSLNSPSPALTLSNTAITVDPYAIPPKSNQPNHGDWPQGQCLNIPACATAILLGAPDSFTEVISHPDSNDTRMQQTTYANGKVWGALDTDVLVNNVHKAGIEYFVVNPNAGKLVLQGTLALAGNNLTYPAIGVTDTGRGVMAFTVIGDDHFASAGYTSLDANVGVGDIHIIAEGQGLDDGFTGYAGQVAPNPVRTRWGDYGAAAVVGNTVWIASEYIAQSCTLAQWLQVNSAGFIGTCGGTRGALGNWSTHISNLTP